MQLEALIRAERELEAARLDREHGFLDQACDHAYYAAFHAAQAVIAARGKTAKTHSGTLHAFAEIVRDLNGPGSAARSLSQLQRRREQTTYSLMPATEAAADDALAKAREVIDAGRELLARIIRD